MWAYYLVSISQLFPGLNHVYMYKSRKKHDLIGSHYNAGAYFIPTYEGLSVKCTTGKNRSYWSVG